ncbi:AMIN domain-containing protein [Tychonema sp. LEGE 07199]|uniref:AMIN domain-containing protein n=1 Tax=unclassified Tychonema TaxID=2642144 RepID=UPI0018826AF0|nr:MULTISPECIES: AMIN domain-containing protein [unclassified Tychonema]MBE9119539.1 AMIN domain-containing protein [Tychonema sp. LEGE 07199]MBE9131743.1 AMIN domain-containing protein [Tychonema sp. LEGE 07196]
MIPSLSGSVSIAANLACAAATTVAILQITLQPANASTVTSWKFDPATNQLEITLPEGTTPLYSLLNPNQIAVDLPNTEIGVDATQLYQGTVRSVGVTQLRAGTTRIVLNLAPGAAFNGEQIQFQRIGVENRWVLRPSIEPAQLVKTPETQLPTAIPVQSNQPPTDSNSTAATEVDRPESPASPNFPTNSVPIPTTNDQIRPITVPLVSVRLNERSGVRPAAVPSLKPQISAIEAPQKRILTFGEPLPGDRQR